MSGYAGPADWWTEGTDVGRTHIATKGINQSGLVLNLDAGASASYPGSGNNWFDISSSNNHGIITNFGSYSPTNGGSIVFGGAAANTRVNVANSASLNFTSGVTLSCWFNYTALPSGEMAFIRKDVQWQLGMINSGTVRCLVATNGTTGWTATNDTSYAFSLNTWYNMSMTYNGSNMVIYVNAIPIKTAVVTGAIVPTTSQIYTGYWTSVSASFLSGKISNLQVYNRGLAADEILKNFNTLRNRFGV